MNLPPTTVALTGTLNTGTIDVPLTRGATPGSGLHLLGNPYPSPLDFTRLTLPAGVDDAVYVARSTSQYGGSYASFVRSVGDHNASVLAQGQGFFVNVSSGTPTFRFTNAAHLTSYQSPAVLRKPSSHHARAGSCRLGANGRGHSRPSVARPGRVSLHDDVRFTCTCSTQAHKPGRR